MIMIIIGIIRFMRGYLLDGSVSRHCGLRRRWLLGRLLEDRWCEYPYNDTMIG